MVKVVKNFVKVNQYTRPGLKLAGVKGIVITIRRRRALLH